MSAPALHLDAESLFSKWGFDDGDVPDWLLDYLDEHPEIEIDYGDLASAWDTVLAGMVRTYLVPLLPDSLEVEEIGTLHNPVRAARFSGEEISWSEGEADMPFDDVTIALPVGTVLAAIHQTLAERTYPELCQ